MTVLFLNYMYKGKTRSDCRTPARIDTFWRLCFNLSRWTAGLDLIWMKSWRLRSLGIITGSVFFLFEGLWLESKLFIWKQPTRSFHGTCRSSEFFAGWFPRKVYLSLDFLAVGWFFLGQVTQCGCRSGRPRGQTHARLGKASKSRGFLASVLFFLGGGLGVASWLHPKGWCLSQKPDNPKSQPSDQNETWKNYTYNPLQREISAYHSFSWGLITPINGVIHGWPVVITLLQGIIGSLFHSGCERFCPGWLAGLSTLLGERGGLRESIRAFSKK